MSLKSDLKLALDDEDFHDVSLVGTDGIRVPANKTMLAMRSPVWKRMFRGNFAEAQSSTVTAHYSSIVLRILVIYCFTDVLDLDLLYDEQDMSPEGCLLSDNEVVSMVELRDAANYLELSSLQKVITNELGEILTQKDGLSCVCAALNELHLRGEDDSPFWEILCAILSDKPAQCFFPSQEDKGNEGVKAFSHTLLTKILSDESLKIPPIHAAMALQTWYENNHGDLLVHIKQIASSLTEQSTIGSNGVSMSENSAAEQKLIQLQHVANSINIEAIAPVDLVRITPSPLFPMERLYTAYVKNAAMVVTGKQAHGHQERFAYVRGAGVDGVNGSYVFDSQNRWWSKDNGMTQNGFVLVQSGQTWHIMAKIINVGSGFRVNATLLYKAEAAPSKVGDATNGGTFTFGMPADGMHTNFTFGMPAEGFHTNGGIPPFAQWKCVNGGAPAPFVALGPLLSTSFDNRKRRILRAKKPAAV